MTRFPQPELDILEARIAVLEAAGGGGGAILAGAATAKTANYLVVAADDGKTFSNVGAGGAVDFDFDAGLVEGFEVRFIRTVNQGFIIRPPAGETLSLGGLGVGAANQGISLTGAVAQSTTLKKIGSTWLLVGGNIVNGALEAIQLESSDLAAGSGIQGADTIAMEGGQTSTAFTFRLVQEVGPNSILGAQDEAGAYVDGADLGAIEGSYLEIQNEDGANAFEWGPDVAVMGDITLNFPTAGDANVGGTSHAVSVQAQVPSVPASQTDTYWVDTGGNVYLRNQGAGGVTSFADAVIAGAL